MARQFPTPPILIVEDSVEVRASLEWLLRVEGYAVVAAIHGADALRQLAAGLRPCVILLDLEMPEMDGFEFRRVQRQDPQLASIPVIIFSGMSDPHAAARELDAIAYVQKPFDLDALFAVIEAHCRKTVPTSPGDLKRAS